MPTTVRLPSRLTPAAIDALIGAIVGPEEVPIDVEFTFDFAPLTFVDSAGLTVFCNALEWLRAFGAAVFFLNHDNRTGPLNYLDDCGFFHDWLGNSINPAAGPRDTMLPFRRLSSQEVHQWSDTDLVPFVAYHLGVAQSGVASLKTCVKELFNNISDHSTLGFGFCHSQYYPAPRKLRLSVADFGLGIPATIAKRYSGLDDAEAVRKATTAGVTSKSSPRNQGIGLDFLVDFVTGNGGELGIYSKRGRFSAWRDFRGEQRRSAYLASTSYPGTVVDLTLHVSKFVGDVEEREDLEW